MLNWIDEELAHLERIGMQRKLPALAEGALNAASNNYLALAEHPRVRSAAAQALERFGAGSRSSRLLSGTLVPHRSLEQKLANYVGRQAALIFPSGYMTNLAVVSSLAGQGDAIVLDRFCHASLIDGAKLSGARIFVYGHGELDEAGRALRRAANYRRRLLITESLFSMDGDFAPLAQWTSLAKRYQAMSLVDEAHALGVWGEEGRGLSLGMSPSPDVVVGTLSKSLGSQGGFVAGSTSLIEYIVNRGRSFIYTTGLSPVCAAAAETALEIIKEEPERAVRLRQRADQFRKSLIRFGWNILHSSSQIVPLWTGSATNALRLASALKDKQIFAPAIRPPTVPAEECRLRFSVTLEATDTDWRRAADALGALRPSLLAARRELIPSTRPR